MIWSAVVSIIFFAGAALFLVRLISEAGFTLPQNRVLSFAAADKARVGGEKADASECARVFLFALIFRVIVYLLAWIAAAIFSDGASFPDYFEKWNLWDAPHYLEIAQNGYAHHIENGQHLFLVFFPLYPLLVRIVSVIARNYAVSAMITSTLCYCGGCAVMYKLVTEDYNKTTARTSVVLLSVSPFAFYFGGIMTESTFFLVTVAMFLAIRRHNWLIAGILGILASLTRSVGVLMVVPAAVEWICSERPAALVKEKGVKELWKRFLKLLPVALTPIGTLIYLYINYKVEGDPFAFMKYQSEHWSMNLQFFPKTLTMLFERGFSPSENLTYRASMFLPALFCSSFAALAVLFGARRLRSMYSAFMIVYFMFNVAASWPLSLTRYMSCMFPAFWLIASFTDEHKQLELPVAVMSAICFGIYLTGYITVHSIM